MSVTHCTYATDKDTLLIRDSGSKILHCRSVTNPLLTWLDMGIPVGLGTDDVYHSMNELLRQNIMGQRFRSRMIGGPYEIYSNRPSVMELLELSTIEGAEVMGMGKEIGSIEPGKKADIIMYSMESPILTPTIDPVASLVLYGTHSDIDTIIVNGDIVKDNGKLCNSDTAKIIYIAQMKIDEMWAEFLKEDPEIRSRLMNVSPYLFK